MRSPKDVQDKLRQAVYRHRKKLIQESLQVAPANCLHNRRLLLPDGEDVGTCGFAWPEGEWPGVCDAQFEGSDLASTCPHFTCRKGKDHVKDEFKQFISTSDLAEVARHYPDVAALMWVLGDDVVLDDTGDDSEDFPYELEIIGIPVRVSTERDLSLLVSHFKEIGQFHQEEPLQEVLAPSAPLAVPEKQFWFWKWLRSE